MRSHNAGLWRHANFLKLWFGQTISLLGSYIGGGALRFTAILILGASPFQIGLLTVASMAPALALGLLAGVWADRNRRRPLLICADLGRALLLLSVPLAYLLGALRIEQLYIVAALMGALTIVFDVAYHAFVPSVVGRGQLVEGNSKLGMSESLAEIAGPSLAGGLVTLISAPFVVLFDALSFLLSALALWRIDTPEATPAAPEQGASAWAEVAGGLRAILSSPLLLPLLATGIIFNFFGNMIGVVYDLYLIRELGASPLIVGLSIGAGGVGALTGAFIAERVARRVGVGWAIIGGLLVSKLGGLLLVTAGGPLWAVMVMTAQLFDMALAVSMINTLSLRQAATPDRLLGRVDASFRLLQMTAGLIGALIGGALGEIIGLRGTIAVALIGLTLGIVRLYFSPVRRLTALPDPDEQPTPAAAPVGAEGAA